MPLYTWSTKDKPQILPSAHFAGTAYQALDSWNLQTAPAPSVQPLPQPALRKRQQRPGENIVLMIYYNTLFQIQKEGWEKCGLMGKGPKGEAGTLVLGQGTSYLSYTGLSRKQQEGARCILGHSSARQ